MEALDSLHSNVRADRENLMTAVHDVGVNATSSITDTDMEAEEDVISVRIHYLCSRAPSNDKPIGCCSHCLMFAFLSQYHCHGSIFILILLLPRV